MASFPTLVCLVNIDEHVQQPTFTLEPHSLVGCGPGCPGWGRISARICEPVPWASLGFAEFPVKSAERFITACRLAAYLSHPGGPGAGCREGLQGPSSQRRGWWLPHPPALLCFPPGSPGPPWPRRGHTASRTQAALLLQRTHLAPGAGGSGPTVGGKTAEEFHLLPENLPGC